MSLKERVYSILIVSATDSFTSTFAALFQKARYSPVETVTSVSKAKWLLISELHMSESDAHRYIEKQAMDRCISKRIVAEEIIKTYT